MGRRKQSSPKHIPRDDATTGTRTLLRGRHTSRIILGGFKARTKAFSQSVARVVDEYVQRIETMLKDAEADEDDIKEMFAGFCEGMDEIESSVESLVTGDGDFIDDEAEESLGEEEEEEEECESEVETFGRTLTDAERIWTSETGEHPDNMPSETEGDSGDEAEM